MNRKDLDFLDKVVSYYVARKGIDEGQFNSLKAIEKGLTTLLRNNKLKQ